MRRWLALTLLVLSPRAFAQQAAAVPDCQALLQASLASDLALDFQAFDQDDKTGWRALASRDCHAQAAALIAAYRSRHPDAHPVLLWHEVQMEASAGHTEAAIAGATKTLRPQDAEAQSAFKWNPYALGTIAFLRGDRAALAQQAQGLSQAAQESDINAPNAKALARLSQCFGQPYRVAYACGR